MYGSNPIMLLHINANIQLRSLYSKGIKLYLKLDKSDRFFIVTIQKVFSPSTMSVVAKVKFDKGMPGHPTIHKGDVAVLKLYDRRFADGLRKMYGAQKHSQALEEEYQADLLRRIPTDDDDGEEDGEDDDPALIERWIQQDCLKHYNAECGIYNRLKDLQGRLIPKFLASVEVKTCLFERNHKANSARRGQTLSSHSRNSY